MAVLDNIIAGTFISAGVPKVLNIVSGVDYIKVINQTQMATTANPGVGIEFEWFSTMAADSALIKTKTNSTNALNGVTATSGGFTLVNTSVPTYGPILAGTTITQANPAVISMASTAGLSNGDIVKLSSVAGMPQLGGEFFTIGSVVANTSIALSFLNSSGFAAPGTAVNVQKVFYLPIFYPYRNMITAVTLANPAVITLSVTHGLTVGQLVTFNVPAAFGMTQLNGLRATITAINTTTNTITVNIDSSAFTAFAFPTGALPFTQAQVIPFGDGQAVLANPLGNQSVLDGATRNVSINGIVLGAGILGPAGQANDVIRWIAFKASQVQTS